MEFIEGLSSLTIDHASDDVTQQTISDGLFNQLELAPSLLIIVHPPYLCDGFCNSLLHEGI